MICRDEEEREFGDKVDMNKTALETIKLFHDKDDLEDFLTSDQAVFWRERGHEFQRLTVDECRGLEPMLAPADADHGVVDNAGFVGGVLCGQGLDSSGDVHLYTSNIAQLARDQGVSVECGVRVRGLLLHNHTVTGVETDQGHIVPADVVIIAAGVRSPHLVTQHGVQCPVYPLRGYLVTLTPAPGQRMVRRNIYSPRHGLLSPLAPDKLRLSGFVEVNTTIIILTLIFIHVKAVGYQAAPDEDKGNMLVDKFLGVLEPDSVDTSHPSHHSCMRPVSGDDVPIIGHTWVTTILL